MDLGVFYGFAFIVKVLDFLNIFSQRFSYISLQFWRQVCISSMQRKSAHCREYSLGSSLEVL